MGVCYGVVTVLNVLWLVLGDRLSLWQQMSIPVVTVGVIAIGAVCAIHGLPPGARRRKLRSAMWVVLAYYLAILSVLLLFGGLFHLDRAWGGAVNLEPFRTIRNFWIHYRRTGSRSSLYNLLGNVVILVPLGVLLPVMFRWMRHFWVFFPLAAAFAVGVEYLQWKTAAGIADVDDAILNFIGAAGGYIVTRLCQMIYEYWKRKSARR